MIPIQQPVPLLGQRAPATGNENNFYRTQFRQRTLQRSKIADELAGQRLNLPFGRSRTGRGQFDPARPFPLRQQLARAHLLEPPRWTPPIAFLTEMAGQLPPGGRRRHLLQLLEQFRRQTVAPTEHAATLDQSRAGVQQKICGTCSASDGRGWPSGRVRIISGRGTVRLQRWKPVGEGAARDTTVAIG